MAKVHVKTKIESVHATHEFDGLAMMQGTRIVYYDNKVKTIVTFGEMVEITRDNEDTVISLMFVPEVKATCKLKQHGVLPMKLELSYLKQDEKRIDIHYKLEDEMFKFHLEYEVIE